MRLHERLLRIELSRVRLSLLMLSLLLLLLLVLLLLLSIGIRRRSSPARIVARVLLRLHQHLLQLLRRHTLRQLRNVTIIITSSIRSSSCSTTSTHSTSHRLSR